MAYESGMGSNGAPFEYAVDVKNKNIKLKKLGFIALYSLWIVLIFAVGLILKLIAPLLCFIPLSTWILVWLTWRYTEKSYEYSFFQGEIKVKRCFGTKTKKEIAKIKIKDITELFIRQEIKEELIQEKSPNQVIFAASSNTAPDLALIFYTNENSKKALFFEINDQAVKIIRYYNSGIIKS